MIIMKFGGTSNQDAAAMRRVVRIVHDHRSQSPVVVISAIAQATNQLEMIAHTAATGDREGAEKILTDLFARHGTIIDNLLTSRANAKEIEGIIHDYVSEIKILVQGVASLRELTPRTTDAICSYGERLSSRIVAAGLQEAGLDAEWIDAKEFMITDDHFGNAHPLMAQVAQLLHTTIHPLLEQGKIPVTQGFIGVTQSGRYTTMGRESSDYSASIIGAAMDAKVVQIWTDVDGILTADPRIVEGTQKLNEISFEEAFELSYFGAKVLHPSTMLPVMEKKIPVQILNSNRTGSGTLVKVMDESRPRISSIVVKQNVCALRCSPRERHDQYMFWESIYRVLNRNGIPLGAIATSEYGFIGIFDECLLGDGLQGELQTVGMISIEKGFSSICIVGNRLQEVPRLLSSLFVSLGTSNVRMISYGASDRSLLVLLQSENVKEVVQAIHDALFPMAG
ncbi:MAG TPA: aspartate kinase [Bacteroidota bacterium]